MNNKHCLRKYALAFWLAATSITVSAGTYAWAAWDWRTPYPSRASLLTPEQSNHLQHFLRNHQNIYRDLQRNPQLANDWSYLRRHDDFRNFLSDHSGIRNAFRTDPYAVMGTRGYSAPAPRAWGRERWGERYR